MQFEYHVHIDATVLPPALEQYALSQGFKEADFAGHPEGYLHFEPNRHMTLKPANKDLFHKAFDSFKQKAQELGLIGYFEGEWVISDVKIDSKPFDDSVPIPFKIERRLLNGPNTDPAKDESFRETEVHLVFDKDASDPRLIRKLLDAGLYGAYINKKGGPEKGGYVGLTLTVQGKMAEIDPMVGMLWNYLNEAGGSVKATIQEERAMGYHLVGVDYKKLPEVAGVITYADADMKQRGMDAVHRMREVSHQQAAAGQAAPKRIIPVSRVARPR